MENGGNIASVVINNTSIMTENRVELGTVFLVQKDNGRQVFEFELTNNININNVINKLIDLDTTTIIKENLSDYFRTLLLHTDLPLTLYKRASYEAAIYNDRTLVFWNYNGRKDYLSINIRYSIIDSSPKLYRFMKIYSIDSDKRFPNTHRVKLSSKSTIEELVETLVLSLNDLSL